jgi:hypothetical protein
MNKLLLLLFFTLISLYGFSQGISFPVLKDTFSFKPATYNVVSPVSNKINEAIIPQDFYTQHFGFFCRQELKLQQAHIPVSFRLGSMDYCNWLEQKPGYR